MSLCELVWVQILWAVTIDCVTIQPDINFLKSQCLSHTKLSASLTIDQSTWMLSAHLSKPRQDLGCVHDDDELLLLDVAGVTHGRGQQMRKGRKDVFPLVGIIGPDRQL